MAWLVGLDLVQEAFVDWLDAFCFRMAVLFLDGGWIREGNGNTRVGSE